MSRPSSSNSSPNSSISSGCSTNSSDSDSDEDYCTKPISMVQFWTPGTLFPLSLFNKLVHILLTCDQIRMRRSIQAYLTNPSEELKNYTYPTHYLSRHGGIPKTTSQLNTTNIKSNQIPPLYTTVLNESKLGYPPENENHVVSFLKYHSILHLPRGLDMNGNCFPQCTITPSGLRNRSSSEDDSDDDDDETITPLKVLTQWTNRPQTTFQPLTTPASTNKADSLGAHNPTLLGHDSTDRDIMNSSDKESIHYQSDPFINLSPFLSTPTSLNPIANTYISIFYNISVLTRDIGLLALVTAPIWVDWDDRLKEAESQIDRLALPSDNDILRDIYILFNIAPWCGNLILYDVSPDDQGLREKMTKWRIRCLHDLLVWVLKTSPRHKEMIRNHIFNVPCSNMIVYQLNIIQLCIVFCLPAVLKVLAVAFGNGNDSRSENMKNTNSDIDDGSISIFPGTYQTASTVQFSNLSNQFRLLPQYLQQRAQRELFSISFLYWQIDPYPSLGYDDVEAFAFMFNIICGNGEESKDGNDGEIATAVQAEVKATSNILSTIPPSKTPTPQFQPYRPSKSHHHPYFQALLTGSTKIFNFLLLKSNSHQISPFSDQNSTIINGITTYQTYNSIKDWQINTLLGQFVFYPALGHSFIHYYYDQIDPPLFPFHDPSLFPLSSSITHPIFSDYCSLPGDLNTFHKSPSSLLHILFKLVPSMNQILHLAPINSLLRLAMENNNPCCIGLWQLGFRFHPANPIILQAAPSHNLSAHNGFNKEVSPNNDDLSPDGSPAGYGHIQIQSGIQQFDPDLYHAAIKFLQKSSDLSVVNWSIDPGLHSRPNLPRIIPSLAHPHLPVNTMDSNESTTKESTSIITNPFSPAYSTTTFHPNHFGEHTLAASLQFFLSLSINPVLASLQSTTVNSDPTIDNINTCLVFPDNVLWRCAYTRYGCVFAPGVPLRANHTLSLLSFALISQERINDAFVNLLLKQNPPPNLLTSVTIKCLDLDKESPILFKILPIFLSLTLSISSDQPPPSLEAMIWGYIDSILLGKEGEHHYRVDLPMDIEGSPVDWSLRPQAVNHAPTRSSW